jgi:hypothetical protein
MQSIDHKGLWVKCDNVGLLSAIGYIYLGNLDFKVWILCVLEILFIGIFVFSLIFETGKKCYCMILMKFTVAMQHIA